MLAHIAQSLHVVGISKIYWRNELTTLVVVLTEMNVLKHANLYTQFNAEALKSEGNALVYDVVRALKTSINKEATLKDNN